MNRNYYVYIYLDPRKPGNFNFGEFSFSYEPIYVGKGKGKRFRELLEESLACKDNELKYNIIRKIVSSDLKPVVLKVKENLTQSSAYRFERFLIKLIGRRVNNTGCLANITPGGDGASLPGNLNGMWGNGHLLTGEKNGMYKNPVNIGKHWKSKPVSREVIIARSAWLKTDRNPTKVRSKNGTLIAWNKGKPATDEAKLNMSKNHADFNGENNPFSGRKHTEDSKKKRIRTMAFNVITNVFNSNLPLNKDNYNKSILKGKGTAKYENISKYMSCLPLLENN